MRFLIINTYILLFAFKALPQSAEAEKEQNLKEEIIVGTCVRDDLQKGFFSTYFFKEYQNYCPKQDILEGVKKIVFDKKIKVVLGTWCQDSQQQVPRFIKILDQVDYNTNQIDFICVDKNKAAANTDISGLNVVKVPTFIIYDQKNEMGRIIETPAATLEEDLLSILHNL